jgi:hypothetical protein
MIVDANVSVDGDRHPIERVLEALGRAKIASAVIFPDARARNIQSQNGYVLRCAQEHDLYPLYYVGGNPWTDTRPDSLEVPDNIAKYAGIRWHRFVGEGIDREALLDEDELAWAVNLMESSEFEALASAAAFYDLPVLFEESFAVTLEFVLRYPSLDIIIPHMGSQSGGQLNVLRELWDAPNVYFDTSLSYVDEQTLARIGTERILFGSGFPYGDPEAELDKIDRLPVPDSAKEGVYGDNLKGLFSSYKRDR